MNQPWNLQDITYKTVRENQYNVAVLPIGSCEPHNLHLPYGSDAFHVTYIAEKMCERAHQMGAKVILLPTLPYGVNSNMLKFPFAMNVHQATLNQVVTDLVASLELHRIFKFLLLNGHGGNEFNGWQRDMITKTNVFIVTMNWWMVGSDVKNQIFEEPGDHADEMETSVNLAINPELVHLEDADDGEANETRFEALNKGWAKIARPWHLLTKHSGCGNPFKATQEKGERYLEIVIERGSKFLKEFSEQPIDDTFPY
ncbi:creatininase family protein [candidate division KSB1 bacterium]|nr:creatininase family protein [candidate division KSB1 bacterium]